MTTTFKVGDRVRYTGKAILDDLTGETFGEANPRKVGMLGTVTGLDLRPLYTVKWDDGSAGGPHVSKNLELASSTFTKGDRVRINNPSLASNGKVGTIHETFSSDKVTIRLDNDTIKAPRMFLTKSLVLAAAADSNPKDKAVRLLGDAQDRKSKAEADIKAAKKDLLGLGVIAESYVPGRELVFDSAVLEMFAETKQPGQRLDKDLLRTELKKAGLSDGRVTRVLAAATVDNKPATSFKVNIK